MSDALQAKDAGIFRFAPPPDPVSPPLIRFAPPPNLQCARQPTALLLFARDFCQQQGGGLTKKEGLEKQGGVTQKEGWNTGRRGNQKQGVGKAGGVTKTRG